VTDYTGGAGFLWDDDVVLGVGINEDSVQEDAEWIRLAEDRKNLAGCSENSKEYLGSLRGSKFLD
jgi:hypothetical protein